MSEDGYPRAPSSYEGLLGGLTEAQREAAIEGPDSHVVVTSGAGTGKTHLLIARLAVLIREFELSPGQELLVLSFTRAAVRAVKERLAVAGNSVRFVTVATFDSFATRLLSIVRPTGAWQEGSYNDRIEAAIEAIAAGEADGHVEPIRHLLVDEVQDLVGIRADLVKALLERIRGGFTLLGDPAQGIYNWSLEGDARREGSAALYRWVRRRFEDDLIEVTLDKNFRAQTEITRRALWAGESLNGSAPDFEEIHGALLEIVLELPDFGRARDAVAKLMSAEHKPTVVLCRNNAQALKFSRALDEGGVPHRVQRRYSDRSVAPWVAKILGNSTTKTMSRRAFDRAYEEIDDPSAPSTEDGWRQVSRLTKGSARDSLDLSIVAERVRSGYVPDELTWTPPTWLVVSTIHRAKGLEFDRVMILSDGTADDSIDDVELAEETRVLYVALTRARSELIRAKPPRTWGFVNDTRGNRWFREGRQRWQVHDVELRGDDVHWMDPAGGFLIRGNDPRDLQTYIGERVRPGDPLSLARRNGSTSVGARVFYEIRHEGTPVGVTAEGFSASLFSILRAHRYKVVWPEEILNTRVDSVDTVAGTEAAGVRAGLGPSAMWLRVRASGLGYLSY